MNEWKGQGGCGETTGQNACKGKTRPELDVLTGDETDETDETAANEDTEGDVVSATASWPDFVIDLARLEWTIDQVFDGPGVEREPILTADQLTSVPAERWPDARLEPVVCLRMLSFKYPVNDCYTAYHRGEDPPIPDPRESYAPITRRDYVVRRIQLSKPQYESLAALVEGRSVGESIAHFASSSADLDALAASLQNLFHIWSANEFVRRVHTSD